MIAFDFKFHSPKTVKEAVELYRMTKSQGLVPRYFSGGTEFISRARRNEIDVDVVINIKDIKECQSLKLSEDTLTIGVANTLTTLIDCNIFPLLTEVARSIATKTAQNKITIGGNIMSYLPYKEALLPFLISDSDVVIAGEDGFRQINIHDLFSNGFKMKDGECLIQLITPKKAIESPFYHKKSARQSRINYPLVTTTSLFVENEVRIAVSGIGKEPIRNKEVERIAKETSSNLTTKVTQMVEPFSKQAIDNAEASAAYRAFILEGMLENILKKREELNA